MFVRSAIRLFAISALIVAVLVASRAATDDAAKARPEAAGGKELSALHASVRTNLDYCRQWLDERDYKTLRRSAEGVALLADALAARGAGEDWNDRVEKLRQAARELADAAEANSNEQAAQRLKPLEGLAATLAKTTPRGEPRELPKPSAPLESMMALLDGTHADAKRSLTFGDAAAARQGGVTLAELGRLLARYKGDAEWQSLAGDLSRAAAGLGELESDDPSAIRAGLRGVYEKCEACHNKRQ